MTSEPAGVGDVAPDQLRVVVGGNPLGTIGTEYECEMQWLAARARIP